MSIEMRPGSGFFYARVKIRGCRKAIPLDVPIEGSRPARMSEKGDEAFERSRIKAEAAARRAIEELKDKSRQDSDLKRRIQIRAGTKTASPAIADVPGAWIRAGVTDPRSPQYEAQVLGTWERFTLFLNCRHRHVIEAIDVTPAIAAGFLAEEAARGLASCRHVRGDLSSVFGTLVAQQVLQQNPFAHQRVGSADEIHRQPFSIEQLVQIVEAVKPDEILRPLVTTAACSAMRLKDCCLLKRTQVDRVLRMILVPAVHKTKKPVSLPIPWLLWAELENAEERRKQDADTESPYVFPELARQYQLNPKWLNSRFEQVLLKLGFDESEDVSKSIRVKRQRGLRRASIRGFQAFKTTWVTIALLNGVPMEIIQRVTGNTVTDVVVKNYFNPHAEEIRRELASRMPELLSATCNRKAPPDIPQVCERLRAMTPETWRDARDALLAMLDAIRTAV